MTNFSATWPFFERDEIEAVERVLESGKVNYWTGAEGRHFEKEFATAVGCDYSVAVSNGTVAMELALHALGVGVGDEVIVTSRTFIGSASCIVMCGATPIIVDVDDVSQNMDADCIQSAITEKTKAIITVHLAGWPCDMDPIIEIARKYNLSVVEDCAQAHGARYKKRPVGSIGDAAAFSFCQDKIITTGGEGGMLTTNSKAVWERAWSYKDHGKSFDTVFNKKPQPGFRWLHESFGTNWRLTEMQSAIGRVQLRKLEGWLEKRRRNAQILNEGFSKYSGLRVTIPPGHIEHSYYKYYVFIRPELIKKYWSRERIVDEILQRGIPCSSGSCSEIYLEKAFKKNGMGPKKRLAVARQLGETSIMFQVHPTLTEADMRQCCKTVLEVMERATGF